MEKVKVNAQDRQPLMISKFHNHLRAEILDDDNNHIVDNVCLIDVTDHFSYNIVYHWSFNI